MTLSKAVLEDAASLHAQYVLSPWLAQAGRNPPVIVRGEGSHFYDERGKKYLDFSAGLVAVNLGHAHAGVAAAIAQQAHTIAYAPPSLANDRRAELAPLFDVDKGLDLLAADVQSGRVRKLDYRSYLRSFEDDAPSFYRKAGPISLRERLAAAWAAFQRPR